MERISIEKTKTYNTKKVLIGTKIVRVNRFIDTETAILLNSLCSDFLVDNANIGIMNIPLFQKIFDMVVLYKCTNLKIDGIQEIEENGKTSLKVNTTESIINNLDNNKVLQKVKKIILNYNDVWQNLLTYLNNQVVLSIMFALDKKIPTDTEISEILKQTSKNIQDTNKIYPPYKQG